ncbi:MAG: hypothetical protein V4515_10420 [Chloroflexota bacterium]
MTEGVRIVVNGYGYGYGYGGKRLADAVCLQDDMALAGDPGRVPAQEGSEAMPGENRPERRIRVHIPIAATKPVPGARLEELVAAHPGVFRATIGKAGGLLIVEYDPRQIDLADLASIVRLAGHPVAPRAD